VTERDRLFWLKVHRRASTMTVDMAADVLRAFRTIREALSDLQLLQLINSGRIDQIIDDALLDRAFLPLQDRLILATKRGFDATVNDLPRAGKIGGEPSVQFNVLSPKVIDAVRKLDTRVINTLKEDVRDVVRAHIENGLRDGRPPKAVARELRSVIGLAPNQEEAVRNFRRALEGDPDAGNPLSRQLRDRRYDAAIKRGELTEEQIDTMTAAYRRKFVAFNADTNARTATLDSYKLGQQISWKEARDKGVIPPGYELAKTWVQIDRPSKRESHIPLHGETVGFDATYSNGEEIPGESDFNCGCLSRVFLRKIA
jgi:hypothetical protein